MKEAIIFDVDGTLINSLEAHAKAWQSAFTGFDIEVDLVAMRRVIGMGSDRIIRDFAPALRPSDAKTLSSQRTQLFLEKYFPDVTVYPHVPAFFEQLRSREIRFGFGSAANDEEMDAYRNLLGAGQASIPQARAERVKASKPSPDVFTDVMRQLALPAAACVVVGDSIYDMQAARSAGMKAIGVCNGAFSCDELMRAGSAVTYDHIGSLYKSFEAAGHLPI